MAKRFSLLAAAAVLLLWMIPQPVGAQDEVKIGIPLAMTGLHAKVAEQHRNGYEMALEEISAQGGIRKGVFKGKKLRFLYKDDEGRSIRARAITENLHIRDRVPIIMGGYASEKVFVVARTTAQYGKPFLSLGGVADETSQKGWKNVFRLNQPFCESCSGLQDFMRKIVNPTSMAILFENTLFGPNAAMAMREWCQENNVTVLMFEPYETANEDFRPLLNQVKVLKPEVIFLASYPRDAVLLTRQSAELEIDSKLFCGVVAGFVLPEYLAGLGKLGKGVMTAVPWSHDVKYPGVQNFCDNYKNKFKMAPTSHAAEAYSAAYVIQDVLERTKSRFKEDLIEAFSQTDMMTVFGPVKFSSCSKFTNQNRVPSLVVQAMNGKPETVWPPELASAKYVYPQPKWKDRR
jgi:branched-chain amino acid transport system substrate-binding protein